MIQKQRPEIKEIHGLYKLVHCPRRPDGGAMGPGYCQDVGCKHFKGYGRARGGMYRYFVDENKEVVQQPNCEHPFLKKQKPMECLPLPEKEVIYRCSLCNRFKLSGELYWSEIRGEWVCRGCWNTRINEENPGPFLAEALKAKEESEGSG